MAIFIAKARPEWALSCKQCQTFIHDDDGQIKRNKFTHKPILRGTVPTPCRVCPKIPENAPDKHWKYAADVDETIAAVWRFYRECNAVKDFPDDPLVRWCAAEIVDAENSVIERRQQIADTRIETVMRELARRA